MGLFGWFSGKKAAAPERRDESDDDEAGGSGGPTKAQLEGFRKLVTELCSLSLESSRVVQIGEQLWELDRMRAMLQAHEVFKMKRGPVDARRLESRWGGIGGPQGWLG